MSMSTRVVGYRPADETWKKMKAVWEACHAANIQPPEEVLKFFDHEWPGDAPGMEVKLGSAVKHHSDNDRCSDVWDVDLSKVPEGIAFIRFENSY